MAYASASSTRPSFMASSALNSCAPGPTNHVAVAAHRGACPNAGAARLGGAGARASVDALKMCQMNALGSHAHIPGCAFQAALYGKYAANGASRSVFALVVALRGRVCSCSIRPAQGQPHGQRACTGRLVGWWR